MKLSFIAGIRSGGFSKKDSTVGFVAGPYVEFNKFEGKHRMVPA